MPKEHVLVNDIITDHRERMLNLKKYYPFFRLSEVSFSWFMDGQCGNLDMGYILMAVLRFFIEENNFKEQDVTYQMYFEFMTACIQRDFGLKLSEQDNKILVDYIFDKLKNDGKPFSFEYYDPVDREKKVSRVRLLTSRIEDGTVWYSISPDGIEFYLDTKEIKDESRISVEQLLLEKMIRSQNFKGGAEVVRRINTEVEMLKLRKNQVAALLSSDVFAGVEAYERFFDTGIKWFEDEQKLFIKNRELIEAALKRAESEKLDNDVARYISTTREIYELDTELKVAMNNHSELLCACTELGVMMDGAIRRSKLSRLRNRFDYGGALKDMIQRDRTDVLEYMIKPFLGFNIRKTFDLAKIEDMYTYRPLKEETAEKVTGEAPREIVFEDELSEARFSGNVFTLMSILLDMLYKNREITLSEYCSRVHGIFGDAVYRNGDFFTFLTHLCGKTHYFIGAEQSNEDTFLDAIIRQHQDRAEWKRFENTEFEIEFLDEVREVLLGEYAGITDCIVRRR